MYARCARIGCLVLTVGLFAAGCGGSGDESADSLAPGSNTATTGATAAGQSDPHPVVVIETTMGNITLTLDAEKAPRTVRNFLNYVDNGHYDGTIFHQVQSDYILLGGGYTEELQERPGRYPVKNEADNGLKNVRGTIAMARRFDVIDSSTCQFFINLATNPKLDHHGQDAEAFGFCVFGKVTDGWDVVEKISRVAVTTTEGFENLPAETVRLRSVRQIR